MVLPQPHITLPVHKLWLWPWQVSVLHPLFMPPPGSQAGGSPPGIECDGAFEQRLQCAEGADGGTPIGVACQSHCSHVQASCSLGQVPCRSVTSGWPVMGHCQGTPTTARGFAWHSMLGSAWMCRTARGQGACVTTLPARPAVLCLPHSGAAEASSFVWQCLLERAERGKGCLSEIGAWLAGHGLPATQ